MTLVEPDTDLEAALAASWRERVGLEIEVAGFLGDVVHVFSHRRLTLSVYLLARATGTPRAASHYRDVRWIEPDRAVAADVGLSKLAHKAIATRALHARAASETLGLAAEPSA